MGARGKTGGVTTLGPMKRPKPRGLDPTLTVVTTVLVAVSITEILSLLLFTT